VHGAKIEVSSVTIETDFLLLACKMAGLPRVVKGNIVLALAAILPRLHRKERWEGGHALYCEGSI
jgi:hypothetical protein